MERIIIIDDKKCEKELAEFLEANKEHIRFNTTFENIKSSSKGFIEELTAEYSDEEKLAIDSNEHIEIVHTRDMTHLEAIGQTTKLHFSGNNSIETNSNLDALGKKLRGTNFLRIHQNFIANLDFFSKLSLGEDPVLLLNNGIKLPIDKDKKNLLISYLKKMEH